MQPLIMTTIPKSARSNGIVRPMVSRFNRYFQSPLRRQIPALDVSASSSLRGRCCPTVSVATRETCSTSSKSLEMRRNKELGGVGYLQRTRELAPILAAASGEIEELRQLPERIFDARSKAAFSACCSPLGSLGGAELDPLSYVQVLEEITARPSLSRLVSRAETPAARCRRPISTRRWRAGSSRPSGGPWPGRGPLGVAVEGASG